MLSKKRIRVQKQNHIYLTNQLGKRALFSASNYIDCLIDKYIKKRGEYINIYGIYIGR